MVEEVFVYLGEPGESDERDDCPLRGLWDFAGQAKRPFIIPIPNCNTKNSDSSGSLDI